MISQDIDIIYTIPLKQCQKPVTKSMVGHQANSLSIKQ
jgi:hypothetical protein